jgi:phosphonate transport system permease protein
MKATGTAVFLVWLFYFSASFLDLDIPKFISRLGNAAAVLQRLMTVDFQDLLAILDGTLSSVCLAVSALAIGFAVSMILSFLAAANVTPSRILSSAIKGGVAVIRAVPALVWILMVVASVGFGNTGGMIGLIFPTVGYLTKSFTASIEDMGYGHIEAMKATGANRPVMILKALVPELTSPFLSWTAIRFEGNIAESISLGMVGVGGVGSMLMKALGKYDYGSITAIILVIFITLFVVELLVNQLKRGIRRT